MAADLRELRDVLAGLIDDATETQRSLDEPDLWCDPDLREHAYAHLRDVVHRARRLDELADVVIDTEPLDALAQLSR